MTHSDVQCMLPEVFRINVWVWDVRSKQRNATHGHQYALRITSHPCTDEWSWQIYSYNVASKLQYYTAHQPLAHQITGCLNIHASLLELLILSFFNSCTKTCINCTYLSAAIWLYYVVLYAWCSAVSSASACTSQKTYNLITIAAISTRV
jgi:hypothetical protein